MKTILTKLTLMLVCFSMASCGALKQTGAELLGGEIKMDSEEAAKLFESAYKEKIDTLHYKPINVWMSEASSSEKLTNNLSSFYFGMVRDNNREYSQNVIIKSGAMEAGTINPRTSVRNEQHDFATMPYVKLSDINPALIQKHIAAAKASMDKAYTFEGVNDYSITIDRKGQLKRTMKINITETGKSEIKSEGGTTIEYFEVNYECLPDGTVVMSN